MHSTNKVYIESVSEIDSDIKAEIVSFLNSNTGGSIFLGAQADGSTIFFNSEAKRKQVYRLWQDMLIKTLKDDIKPDVTGLVKLRTNKVPFEIIVSAGPKKPYYINNGEGINLKGIYTRIGNNKRLASDAEIFLMINKSKTVTDIKEETKNQLTFEYANNAFQGIDKIININANKDEEYNQAALLISDQNPFTSKVAVYQGVNNLDFLDRKTFKGSIIKQIDQTLQYINLNNKKQIKVLDNGRRQENQSYPSIAVREAIVNAFVHRDYSLNFDIIIEMYDNKISITSPGTISEGLSICDIKQGANAKRNPILVNTLDTMKYVEDFGSGIRLMCSQYQNFIKKPEFIITDNSFTVILYNTNYTMYSKNLNETMIKIIDYLIDGKHASRKEIQDHLGLKKSYTSELILELNKKSIIKSIGRGRATRYYLTA